MTSIEINSDDKDFLIKLIEWLNKVDVKPNSTTIRIKK